MTSPDITPYSDLTIYDQQPDQVYDTSIDYARVAIPEWRPVTGSIEDAIFQAASGVSAELLGAINRVPASILEALLKLFGIDRLTGTAPTGEVLIEFIDSFAHTIPRGTRFGWYDNSDLDNPILYVFETIADVTSIEGESSAVAEIQGIQSVQYPDLQDGTPFRVLSGNSNIYRATLNNDLTAGADPETDSDYFTRAITLLRSYSAALVLPQQFESYMLSNYNAVYRAKAFSRLDPDSAEIANVLPVDGQLTIYACGLNGASLSYELTNQIESDLTDRAVAGLVIHVVPPLLVPIEVDAIVVVQPTYNATVVLNAVKKRLEEYLTPNYWSWGDQIFYNEVVNAIDAVPGVARVVDLALASSVETEDGTPLATTPLDTLDLAFTYYGSLPSASITVTGRTYDVVEPRVVS